MIRGGVLRTPTKAEEPKGSLPYPLLEGMSYMIDHVSKISVYDQLATV